MINILTKECDFEIAKLYYQNLEFIYFPGKIKTIVNNQLSIPKYKNLFASLQNNIRFLHMFFYSFVSYSDGYMHKKNLPPQPPIPPPPPPLPNMRPTFGLPKVH